MENKLYMVLLGCTPQGRNIEQHDIFFGIAPSLKELVPQMNSFWPEANAKLHIDCWREVTHIDGFSISVVPKTTNAGRHKLFFINLGGYKKDDFEEYHYKILNVAEGITDAVKASKETAFFKHCGIQGGPSHIDDKYGIDADDVHKVYDILSDRDKEQFTIAIVPKENLPEDKLHIGYIRLDKI